MRLQAVLKYLNGLIALLLLIALGAGFYWVWRPMPKRSGTVSAAVAGAATATRDDLGVPLIKASSIEDALFVQGYVTAQDRMWQMDAIRRLASGQLSEVLGSRTLELDRETRKLRMGRLAHFHARRLAADDRRWVAAYARGVNHYIDTHRRNLPLEFTLLGYEPRMWTIADTMLVALQMHRDLTTIWRTELAKAAGLAVARHPDLLHQLLPQRLGTGLHPGSNAWAISGKHTASGKPLLASDPHLEYNSPSTWYMTHLQAPGLNVRGVSLPGIPGVIIGHNDRIAWGITNLQFDVQDLYIEQLDTRTGRYLHRGQPLQARQEYELIRVKNSRPVEFTNLITVHGPMWQSVAGRALTLRWTAAEDATFAFPLLDLNRATDWQSFRAALARFPGPAQNFVYADVNGNIGYQAAGSLPIRRSFKGDVPVDGASGQFEWEGFVAFEDLPTAFNPPDGRIVSANQDPFPTDWKYGVNGNFASPHRARQIRNILASRGAWTPEEMVAIQKDVYSGYLHYLARVAAAVPGADPQAARILKAWNGQMEKGQAAPLIAHLLSQQLRIELAKRAAGQPLTEQAWPSAMAVEALLRARPREWYPDWNQPVAQSLAAAMDEARRLQGRDPNTWDWGNFLTLELKNPIVAQIPWIGTYQGVDRAAMSGSGTSVKQTQGRLGPSMRFVADLSNWDNSLNNITLGQSGHAFGKHSRDQWDRYYVGRSFPMRWSNITGDALEFRPQK
ncbi:MAG TPA: penicillin acylase family protein [Bryobacteraceae bacterium]|nr:penicillin acylase family protein [Bryobacteraceae bacterium]